MGGYLWNLGDGDLGVVFDSLIFLYVQFFLNRNFNKMKIKEPIFVKGLLGDSYVARFAN